MLQLVFAALLLLNVAALGYSHYQQKSHPAATLADHNDSTLLESGKAATLKTSANAPSEVKVVSYNIRWRSGDDLKKLNNLLREDPEIGSAAILALQEVDRRKKRTGHTNVAKIMVDELEMH